MRQTEHTAKSSICRICKAEAHIINYGALSCYSCKTFFRRHVHRIEVYICFDFHLPILFRNFLFSIDYSSMFI
jgi:hypothetical protein